MATGCDSHIESVFEELVLPEQATPMIRPLKGQLTSPVDLNRYLYDVPFIVHTLMTMTMAIDGTIANI